MTGNGHKREAEIEQRVLLVQAAAEAAVLAICVPVEDEQPGSIVLSGMMAPEFQFDVTGRVLPIVAEINSLIHAAADPWAAASWWIGHDSYLAGTPVDAVAGNEQQHAILRMSARRYLAPPD